MFRLGADLAVRLPRRAAAAGLIENERRWSIARWIPGEAADLSLPHVEEGAALGRFLTALHVRRPSRRRAILFAAFRSWIAM